ncbi:hypothetical protein Q1695_006836 [Nippostrongylus brasiliensis]|nr:hypothetical protein Q1695_006836 [Nippostrongylus brasiliensis]
MRCNNVHPRAKYPRRQLSPPELHSLCAIRCALFKILVFIAMADAWLSCLFAYMSTRYRRLRDDKEKKIPQKRIKG